MNVSYIYNSKGNAEYVVIPVILWNKLNNLLEKENTNEFHPNEYKGILSDLNLDIDAELLNIREEWTRNI